MFERRRSGYVDPGFSMVEIVISMFLIGILSIAVLPLIFGATKSSVQNRSALQATALANAQLSKLQADFPATPGSLTSCAVLALRAGTSTDAATGMKIITAFGACPVGASSYPVSIPVLITVQSSSQTVTTVTSRLRTAAA